MLEKFNHVSNPLTVIAIFAGIVEVSGTVVLPFVTEANQSTYLLFLMAFPSALVLLFFVTLNFNHKVLYAPSDFSDESYFLQLINKQFNEAKTEIVEKVEKEMSDKVHGLEERLSHNQLILRSKEALDSGDMNEALSLLKEAFEITKSMAAYKLSAIISKQQGDIEKAIEESTIGLDLKNGTISAKASLHFNRACYKSLARYEIESIMNDLKDAILLNTELLENVFEDDVIEDPGRTYVIV